MKSLLSIILLNITFLMGCTIIPRIQNGNQVKKITVSKIHLTNGKTLKTPKNSDYEKTTIILVRHAEKMKDSKDPDLTEKGINRANQLSKILADIQLDHVFSTNYKRTLQTAQPTATAQSLEVENYNPRNLEGFVNILLDKYIGNNILVVGHSNTTPQVMNLLMDKTIVESIEESDYNNIYVVTAFAQKDKKENKAVLLTF